MTRVLPKPGAARLAAVGRVGPEAVQLPVGQRFARDASQPKCRAGKLEGPDPAGGIDEHQNERNAEQRDEHGLRLEKSEKHGPCVIRKLRAQRGIAPVFLRVMLRDANEQIRAEARGPDRDHEHEQHAAPEGTVAEHRTKSSHGDEPVGPENVHDPRIVQHPRERPDDSHHHDRNRQRETHQPPELTPLRYHEHPLSNPVGMFSVSLFARV